MIKNYERDKNGVIFQIEKDINAIKYDHNYIEKGYKNAPNDEMSYLRLGFLVGAIGKTPRSLLDVGYGNGSFLKVASKLIDNVYGYDCPPAYPIKDIPIVDSIHGNYYDVICFFDSLEHFHDINEIKSIKAEYVYISLPWCHYLSDEWFYQWKHRKENEHLWHFNIESLTKFMSSFGYTKVCHANIEDTIRKCPQNNPNILSAIFKKTY